MLSIENKHLKLAIKITLPLIVIGLMTLCCCYLYLFDGITSGDDFRFHMGNIYEVYYGLKNGLSIDSTNHLMMGAYAYNTHLFYAPLPHYAAGIMMYVFNLTTIEAVKWFMSLMNFFAGIMFYCLAYKMTKKMSVSLLSAAFFLFCPYRMFCGLARFAYAETIAMCFIPCFFYGIYSVTHDETPKAWSFLSVILGGCGLILSHPFTAICMALFAVLYMVVNFKGVWRFLKTKKGIIYSVSTVVLIIMGVGFYAFPMVQALGTGIYRMSDANAVWTTYAHVSASTLNSSSFSGFLNLVWIASRIEANAWNLDWTPALLSLSVSLVAVGGILAAIADLILSRLPNNKYYRLPIMLIVSYLPICFFKQRIEVYLAMALFDVMLIVTEFIKDKSEGYFEKKGWFKRNKGIVIDVSFLLIVTAIAIVFIYVPGAWKNVPSAFYSCQFAWRLWSVVSLSMSLLFVYGLNATTYIKKVKTPFYLASILPFLMFSASQGYVEKKYLIDNNGVWKEFGQTQCEEASNIGVMNEYIPLSFYDENYSPSYSNSLFRTIKSTIGSYWLYQHTADDYLTPVFLEGSGSIIVTDLNTPSVDLSIVVSEDALIQIPQFFYDGYLITAYDELSDKTIELEPTNVDDLVSFKLPAGNYDVEVRYIGPKLRRVFNILFYVGLAGTASLAGYGIYESILRKKNAEATNI